MTRCDSSSSGAGYNNTSGIFNNPQGDNSGSSSRSSSIGSSGVFVCSFDLLLSTVNDPGFSSMFTPYIIPHWVIIIIPLYTLHAIVRTEHARTEVVSVHIAAVGFRLSTHH